MEQKQEQIHPLLLKTCNNKKLKEKEKIKIEKSIKNTNSKELVST